MRPRLDSARRVPCDSGRYRGEKTRPRLGSRGRSAIWLRHRVDSSRGRTMSGFAEYESYDALGLAALVKAGEVSETEVLEAAIARVESRNPTINAVVMELYDHAAKAVAAGLPDGPLKGVPFLLKDLGSALAGARTARGSRFFADLPPASRGQPPRRPAQAGRHGDLRQDEHLRARPQPHLRAAALRPLAQSLGPGADAGRAPAAARRRRFRRACCRSPMPRTASARSARLRPPAAWWACAQRGRATPWRPTSANRSAGSPSSTRYRSRSATARRCSMPRQALHRAIPTSRRRRPAPSSTRSAPIPARCASPSPARRRTARRWRPTRSASCRRPRRSAPTSAIASTKPTPRSTGPTWCRPSAPSARSRSSTWCALIPLAGRPAAGRS